MTAGTDKYKVMNRNRRAFLKLSALGVGLSITGGCGSLSFSRKKSSKKRKRFAKATSREKLRFAFIGVGGIGRKHLQKFSVLGVSVVALCDVDERELYAARDMISSKHPSVRIYKDFRVMLQNVPGLDAVVISTPDHGHGMQAVHALRTGCHVFLETPLTHTLEELAVLEKEADKAKRIVLPGDCGCRHEEALRANEVISTGVLGNISKLHIWTNRPVWPQGCKLPVGNEPVPETFDWQLWLAGAKPRSYKRYAYHKFNWRGWTDFGGGVPGDIGCRLLGFPYKVLKLQAPYEVKQIFSAGGTEFSYPKSSELLLKCKSKQQKKPVAIHWYDGGRMPRAELLTQVKATLGKIPGTGTLIIGEHGSWLVKGTMCDQHYMGLNGGLRMVDLEKHELWTSVPKTLPRCGIAEEFFLHAIPNSRRFDFGVNANRNLNQAVLIGMIAQRLSGTLRWHAKKRCFIKNEEANELLAPYLQENWRYY